MSKIIPNSYQCPNFYCDELMYLLSGEEWKVLDYTVRRILGFHKDRDHISLTQYCEGIKDRNGNALDHGTGLSRPTAIDALATLTACKVIAEIEEESNNKGKCYTLQLDSDKVDFAWLNARRERKHAATSERTVKGRTAAQEKSKAATEEKAEVVNGIDRSVVNPIDQQVVNAIDRKVVNRIDRGVVNGIDTHSIQEKASGKPEREAPVSQSVKAAANVSRFVLPANTFDPAKGDNWSVGERFILKACDLWEKPILELDPKIKISVKANGKWVNEKIDVKAQVGGTPTLFREFWFSELKRKVNPRPEYVVEQWDAYDRWLIENHETHRQGRAA